MCGQETCRAADRGGLACNSWTTIAVGALEFAPVEPPRIKPKGLDDYLEQLSRGVFQAGISWRFYNSPQFPIGNVLLAFRKIRFTSLWNNVVESDTFLNDIQDGRLAQVSWVNPPAPYNEHTMLPHRDQSVCAGENWSVAVMNALQESPYWGSTAVVMVWDDFGGF